MANSMTNGPLSAPGSRRSVQALMAVEGASSPIRRIASHRLQSAGTGCSPGSRKAAFPTLLSAGRWQCGTPLPP